MMKNFVIVILGICALSSSALAQTKPEMESTPVGYFLETDRLPLFLLLPPPPAENSEQVKKEFADLHKIQDARTPDQVRAAQKDDAEQDIFIYQNVLGEEFNAKSLPLTAQLGAHVHHDEPVIANVLKYKFHFHSRPFEVDSTIHPVCKLPPHPGSYPSGHTISGYLLGFTLTLIVPEKKEAILARAEEYAHNRLVCGLHTASDIEASRLAAYAAFGAMLQEGKFQQELEAARIETRNALHLDR